MKYGVNLFLWCAAFTRKSLDLLPKVAKMGFDGVEIPLDLLDQIDVKETKKVLVSEGLGCTCCENDRGTPGTGHINWRGVFKALHEINYNRWIVIESFVPGVKEIAKKYTRRYYNESRRFFGTICR